MEIESNLITYQSLCAKIHSKLMIRAYESQMKEGHLYDLNELREPYFDNSYIGKGELGLSVYASQDIRKGERVSLLPLTLIKESISQVNLKALDGNIYKVLRDIHLPGYAPNINLFTYSDMFINHSCQNNATYGSYELFMDREEIVLPLIANKDISKNEEITLNYGVFEFICETPFLCKCGAPNCIREYRGLKFFPKNFQDELLNSQSLFVLNAAKLYAQSKPKRRKKIIKNYVSKLTLEDEFYFYFFLSLITNVDADDYDDPWWS